MRNYTQKILLMGILIMAVFTSHKDNFSASEVTKSTIGVTIGDTFPDEKLASCVATNLGKNTTDPVVQTDLDGITELACNGVNNIEGIDLLTNVNTLELKNGKIENIELLGGLTSLTTLNMYTNQIVDINALSGLTNLTTLTLSQNKIEEVDALSGLTNLTTLDLSSNQIAHIDALSELTDLTTLDLHANQITDISVLSKLKNLTSLNLGMNVGLKDNDLGYLSNLTNLTTLQLYNNKFKNIGALSELTNLTTLDLQGNQISDISPLAGLTKLVDLKLRSNQINDVSVLSNLTNLLSLDLGKNQISDISPLAGLTKLVELNLSSNQISDISVLSNLTNLLSLDLSSNQISDISTLSTLTNLFSLNLKDQTVDLGALATNSTNIPALISVSLKAMDDSEFTSGMVDYEFLNGETVDGNKINLNSNIVTPIDFIDGNFSGTIKFSRKPIILTPGNTSITQGDKLDILDKVSAEDGEDGDLTSAITVDNPDKFRGDGKDPVGDYKLTYTVADSAGNITNLSRTITVKSIPIILQSGDVVIHEGETLNILAKVKAIDSEDGDLTKAITVDNPDNFRGDGTDAIGSYMITYTVIDSDGNVASVDRTITVLEKKDIDSTDIKDVDSGNTNEENTNEENTGTVNEVNSKQAAPQSKIDKINNTLATTGLGQIMLILAIAAIILTILTFLRYKNRKV